MISVKTDDMPSNAIITVPHSSMVSISIHLDFYYNHKTEGKKKNMLNTNSVFKKKEYLYIFRLTSPNACNHRQKSMWKP